MLVDLGLGSNMLDRLGYLQAAVDGLRRAGMEIVAVSSVYETTPVGGPGGQRDYLNAVVRVETDLSPLELLDVTQELERQAKRTRDVHHGPRTLDLDILRCGDLVISTSELTVPHPEMAARAFVLVPLADIDPTINLSHVDTTGVAPTELTLL